MQNVQGRKTGQIEAGNFAAERRGGERRGNQGQRGRESPLGQGQRRGRKEGAGGFLSFSRLSRSEHRQLVLSVCVEI